MKIRAPRLLLLLLFRAIDVRTCCKSSLHSFNLFRRIFMFKLAQQSDIDMRMFVKRFSVNWVSVEWRRLYWQVKTLSWIIDEKRFMIRIALILFYFSRHSFSVWFSKRNQTDCQSEYIKKKKSLILSILFIRVIYYMKKKNTCK